MVFSASGSGSGRGESFETKQEVAEVTTRWCGTPTPSFTDRVEVVELLLGYQLNLTQLSKKLATLLALATFLRVSELSSILRQLVRFSNSGVSFSLGRPRKAQHGGALRTIVVDKLSDPLIRPVQCLGSYIYLTDVKRNEKNGLFSPLRGHRSLQSRFCQLRKSLDQIIAFRAGKDSSFTAH
jgi:hypothetical protein